MTKMIERIRQFNPWLANNNYSLKGIKHLQRSAYKRIVQAVSQNLIVAVTGLRRVGKTTMLKQLIGELLKKVPTKQVFYVQFDEDFVDLAGLIEYYLNNILGKSIHEASCYIFLDELQYVHKWEVVLKRYYDINPQIQFIVSGSTNLFRYNETQESLAGRMVDIFVPPLSYHEFLNLQYSTKLNVLPTIMQDDFIDQLISTDLLLKKDRVNLYLRRGEFPYTLQPGVEQADYDLYINSALLDKIFKRDIQLFDIEKKAEFYKLFRVLCHETGNSLSLEALSREISINKKSIKKYLEIIEKMFLSTLVERESKSVRRQLSFPKKNYVRSLNIVNVVSGISIPQQNKVRFGLYVETFVFNELSTLRHVKITTYFDSKRKKEVDFILTKGEQKVPIEVKTNTKTRSSMFNHLKYFMRENHLSRGVLLYGGNDIKRIKFDYGIIDLVPWWVV